MKPKMHHQVQPPGTAPPHNAHVHGIQVDVEGEIEDFLQAMNSYPARVAKDPRVTFREHLSSISAARNDEGEDDSPGSRSRRH